MSKKKKSPKKELKKRKKVFAQHASPPGTLEYDPENQGNISKAEIEEQESLALELESKFESIVNQFHSMHASPQILIALKQIAELASEALGGQLYRYPHNPPFGQPQEEIPKSREKLAQYVHWKHCKSAFAHNQKNHLRSFSKVIPDGRKGKPITNLDFEVYRAKEILGMTRERPSSHVGNEFPGEEVIKAALKLPPFSKSTINKWAHAIDLLVYISPKRAAQASNYNRDKKRIKDKLEEIEKKKNDLPKYVWKSQVQEQEELLRQHIDRGQMTEAYIKGGRIKLISDRLRYLLRFLESEKA